MAEEKTIEYCMLNVAASPHPDGAYLGLLETAALKPVNYWGDHFATISRPEKVKDGFLRGRVVAWTEIDKNEPAVLTDRLQEINFNDLKIDIPDNVGFNGRVFLYVFRESDHTLFVEVANDLGKRLSPQRARKIFGMLFDAIIQGVDAPLVEVTIIPEEDALRRILSIPTLKRLRIHLVRPNADDLDVKRIMERLEAQRAKSEDIILVALPSHGIELNEENKTIAEVAEHNGFVEGSGQEDDGAGVKYSTREYPRIIKRIVGQIGSSFAEAMAVASETLLRAPRD
ncbi:DUF4747 family protein [Mesorhizobium sp. M0830]|uniref:DUF4747 family protein n=1 Tax=Mesorhizobium sp. M0830 TaxID=2957008 RepID=UPI00333C1E99